jgi:hypothetical protein
MEALALNLGKGEVVSSILTGSTIKSGVSETSPVQNHAERNMKVRAQYAPNPHHVFTAENRL